MFRTVDYYLDGFLESLVRRREMSWCICASRLRIMSVTGHAVAHGSVGFQQREVAVNGLAMLKKLFQSTRKNSRRAFRPAVEALEGRLAPTLTPTTLVPSGGGDGTNVMSWVPVAGAVKYNIYSGPAAARKRSTPRGLASRTHRISTPAIRTAYPSFTGSQPWMPRATKVLDPTRSI
jgi:hypothetical protein